MNKKGEAVTAIVIVIIIVVFLGWLINVGYRECNSNSDCGKGSYCSVEHNCNKIPVLEKEVIVKNNYMWPAVIIGLAIVIAAVILRRRNGKKEEIEEDKAPEEPSVEPYYTNF